MIRHFANFIRDDSANATVEYAIVACVFGMALIGVCQAFLTSSGAQLSGTQSNLQTTAMVPPTPAPGT